MIRWLVIDIAQCVCLECKDRPRVKRGTADWSQERENWKDFLPKWLVPSLGSSFFSLHFFSLGQKNAGKLLSGLFFFGWTFFSELLCGGSKVPRDRAWEDFSTIVPAVFWCCLCHDSKAKFYHLVSQNAPVWFYPDPRGPSTRTRTRTRPRAILPRTAPQDPQATRRTCPANRVWPGLAYYF